MVPMVITSRKNGGLRTWGVWIQWVDTRGVSVEPMELEVLANAL